VDLAEKVLSTRKGTVLIGIAAAALAGILLIVYLNRYRASLKGSDAPLSVLVAKRLIQSGSPGAVIGTQHQFQVSSISKSDVVAGAITDPSTLRGLVATHDIYPGQQLTAADFAPLAPDALQAKLTGKFRAIQLPFDNPHGMMSQLQPSDHVDVYVLMDAQGPGGTTSWLKLLMQNALVLRTPTTGAAGGTVVVRAPGVQAAELAFAADKGKIWLVLRPASGAKPALPGLITAQRLLLGARPVR
jgi:Flp pilus assembly protein CpaB